ncbi:MAG TPA: 6-phosphogluconolactonase [Panacibacter sp.]|nr:6-phosphogluconolactonase [Panacibacter sp.]HNP44523.1 6-phosphogluconolactonase [Panacibacter sp.]
MNMSISADINLLSIAVADWMVELMQETLEKQDRFTLVLSGGNTPKKLNELLTTQVYKNAIDWTKVHIFFGDERFVPFADERNNAKMAFDTLLNHVPVARENIHIMQTENISPEESANAYETILKQYFPTFDSSNSKATTFDLVLLGVGDDGHTLSLFPGKTEVIQETEKLCTSLWLEEQNIHRITLTHPIVNQSAAVAFLASGSNKAQALKEVLYGVYNPAVYPSQIIKPVGELHWFVDEAAASLF